MNAIRIYREKHNLSQVEFGFLIGVGQTAVANYETGYRIPSFRVARQIHEKTKGAVPVHVTRPDIFGTSPTQPIPAPPPPNEKEAA